MLLFHHLPERAASLDPSAPALSDRSVTLSYGEFADATRHVASGLLELSLKSGDRVAIYLDKRVEAVVSMFAASAAGGVFVPINPLLKGPQVGHILRDCDVKVLVTTMDRLEQVADEIDRCDSVEQVVVVGDRTTMLRSAGVTSWADVSTSGSGRSPGRRIDVDMAAILYTSGSTGLPKGVVLSHRNVVAGAQCVNGYLGNTADDRILALLPLSFDAGMSQITTGFEAGAEVVLQNYLLARDVVRVCRRRRITALTCVPPLWSKLAQEEWSPDASDSLRYFANTGGHMPRTTLDALRRIFTNAKPFLMYGLTEAFRSTYLDPDEVDRRPDSIGKAIPGNEVLVIGDDGHECAPGEVGELVHRGVLVSLGYWNQPELTNERFRPTPGRPSEIVGPEFAVFSGDLVRRDDEGFLYFVGRKDDMIKTSGYRVSPSEVEEGVASSGLVGEVAAFGVDDDELGQRIVVVVTPASSEPVDADVVLAHCRKVLPSFMVPHVLVERDALPRNPNGKFDRVQLRRDLSG